MDVTHPLGRLLFEAAHDRFPPADGRVEVLPSPPGRSDAVVAFTAHSVVAAGVEPGEVLQRLPADDLGAPTSAPFLAWLGQRLGAEPGMVDLVMVAFGGGGEPSRLQLVEVPDWLDHPRVTRANLYRSDVVAYADPERRGVVTIGRGLCGRLELALEIDPAHRGRGLGRDLTRAALSLVPVGEPLFAQVTPGNVMSIRAFLAAGYRPICSEVLFLRR
jgi:GNAT superfamily N-acetyltransferase